MSEEQKNSEDYTADGLYTLKKQLEIIDEIERKQPYIINPMIENRELLQRVKILGLYHMGLDIFTDTRNLNRLMRERLQTEMHKYNGKSREEIIEEFNRITCIVLECMKDVSKLPVYTAN
jgi:hypothetical protein